MSNTILRTVGTQSVAFEFNSLADAHTYAATAEHALRDAKARLAHAKKLTADAFARLPANHGTVKDEFFDLVDRYFKMPRPVGPDALVTYKSGLRRILNCLSVTFDGLNADHGVTFAQLSDAKCGEGYKGLVQPTESEAIVAYFSGDAHDFTKESPLSAKMQIDFRMLQSNFPLAVNTMIHEATHKYCVTWDHVYFGAGGQEINADQTWFANCKIRVLMADPASTFFNTTPSRLMTRALARAELLRAMRAENFATGAPEQDAKIVARHAQVVAVLDQQGTAAGQSVFNSSAVQNLPAKKALNNADSYSCYVMDMPGASVQ